MRILWHSNAPHTPTGYGNQTRITVPRLKRMGNQVGYSCFWGIQGSILHMDGDPMYPAGYTPYGTDVIAGHAAHFGADMVVTLVDPWIFEPEAMRGLPRWLALAPIDAEPLSPENLRALGAAWRVGAISHFGERVLRAAGLKNVVYLPHGVDTHVFAPLAMNEAREKLGLPADRFIVGVVAANKDPLRKALQESIEAFGRFHAAFPDAMLYLHTTVMGGNDLPACIVRVNERLAAEGVQRLIGEHDIMFPSQYQLRLGLPDEAMNWLYNSFDVLLAASRGEGFGIPVLEAQAAGCPVIVSDFSSQPELLFAGWKVGGQQMLNPQSSWWLTPDVGEIAKALVRAHAMRGVQSFRDRARDGALAYDIDLIVGNYWMPFLAETEAELRAVTRAASAAPSPAELASQQGELEQQAWGRQ